LIKSLLKQELLGTKSLLIWDGTNEETIKMPIGIYVIWAELTNPDGTMIHHKKACVLAHKN
jgi:flagellar hook assembly protein FlgD